jgi:hypothetical protein
VPLAHRAARADRRTPKCEDRRVGASLSAFLPPRVSLTPPLPRLDSISQKARVFARFGVLGQLPQAALERRADGRLPEAFHIGAYAQGGARMSVAATVVSAGSNGIAVRSSVFACRFKMRRDARAAARELRRVRRDVRGERLRHGSCLLAHQEHAAPLGGLVSEETAA